MKNAVIYARYSSSSQREESIEIQLEECRAYCEENGYTVVDEYIDKAMSGTTDDRPGFQRMISDRSKGLFDTIVVYRFNRFSRSQNDSVVYKAMLKKDGIKVLSVNEYIDDSPTGRIVEGLIEVLDEFYSLELAQKIRKGMNKNGEKCLCTGGNIALGYVVDEDRRFQVDPNTAPIVQTVFQMYADGKTVTEITTHLNSLGYKTARGVPFNKNSLHTMLKNKRYIGVYTYKGQETPGGMPRIISDELFNKVAERMETNRKAPARARAKAEYLLTTKLFCGYCKQMMTGFSGKGHLGKRYNYYICNKRKLKNCEKKMVKKDYLENLVISICRKFLSVKNIEKIAREVSAICQAERDTSNMRYLQKRIADTERKRENALNAVLETDNARLRENLYQKIEQLEAEQEALQIELSKEVAPFPSLTEPKIKFFLTALKKGSANDVKYQKMLIKIFVNQIFLYDDRITITFNAGNDTVEINERLLEELEANDEATKNLFIDGDGPPARKAGQPKSGKQVQTCFCIPRRGVRF